MRDEKVGREGGGSRYHSLAKTGKLVPLIRRIVLKFHCVRPGHVRRNVTWRYYLLKRAKPRR